MHYIIPHQLESLDLLLMLSLDLHLHANASSQNLLVSFLLQILSPRTKNWSLKLQVIMFIQLGEQWNNLKNRVVFVYALTLTSVVNGFLCSQDVVLLTSDSSHPLIMMVASIASASSELMIKYLHVADSSFKNSDLKSLIFYSLSITKFLVSFRPCVVLRQSFS